MLFKFLLLAALALADNNMALTPGEQNGASTLGTLDTTVITGKFLPDSDATSPATGGTNAGIQPNIVGGADPSSAPWGTQTADEVNAYSAAPLTGITRKYDFIITRQQIAPDGYLKDVILINQQFPGPTIYANRGDMIQVNVHNNIDSPQEGTSIHWHGLLQSNTTWEDGVPSIHNCPIPPGQNFTYLFKADIYGTSWYHSHYSGQSAGGLLGPIVIFGPLPTTPYDNEHEPIVLGDWFHEEYYDILKKVVGNDTSANNFTSFVPASDNSLISGKMSYNCSLGPPSKTCSSAAALASFSISSKKTTRLRLINAGSDGQIYFSIDNHNLTVIANDFVVIKPYTTNVVALGVGQRTDVLVTANQDPSKSYYMRSNVNSVVGCGGQNLKEKYDHIGQSKGLAVLYYDQGSGTQLPPDPVSKPQVYKENPICQNDNLALTVPEYKIPVKTPSFTYNIEIVRIINATGHPVWMMNGKSFRGNYNDPILLDAAKFHQAGYKGSKAFADSQHVVDLGKNTTVRLVVHNTAAAHHPIHLHGHNMQVLHEGSGPWDGKSLVNIANPQRRDVQQLPILGHIVVQFDLDNPGVWPFHCHNAWHASAGLVMNFLERGDDIQYSKMPLSINATCQAWNAFTKTVKPGNFDYDIDSGV